MGVAELQEGGIGQIGADRVCHRTFIGLQHGGWVDDLKNPLLLEQFHRLADARIHTDCVEAGADGIEDHQFVELDRRHLEQGKLLVGERGVEVVVEPVGSHGGLQLSGQHEMVVGTAGQGRREPRFGPAQRVLSVVNLAFYDRDAVAELEHTTHSDAHHKQGATQNPGGFGDLGVRMGLAAYDDGYGAFAGEFRHQLPLVAGHLDLGVVAGG